MGSLQSDFVKSVKEPRQQRHEDYDADLLANEIDGIVIHEYNYPCNRRQEDCKWLPLVPDSSFLRQPDGDGEAPHETSDSVVPVQGAQDCVGTKVPGAELPFTPPKEA